MGFFGSGFSWLGSSTTRLSFFLLRFVQVCNTIVNGIQRCRRGRGLLL